MERIRLAPGGPDAAVVGCVSRSVSTRDRPGIVVVVGLTGTIACGKEVVGASLQRHGFTAFSLSDAVRDEARRRAPDDSRRALQDIGNELREREGADVWARRTLQKLMGAGVQRAVVDGIRNPMEAELFKAETRFFLIGVDASQETRFKRLSARARPGDSQTWGDFLQADSRDRGGGESAKGQQVDRCLKIADFLIRNEGTVEEVERQVETIVRRIELAELSADRKKP